MTPTEFEDAMVGAIESVAQEIKATREYLMAGEALSEIRQRENIKKAEKVLKAWASAPPQTD